MEFTRLRISGFKSFCDATELDIGPGLTGIVGPNGCGKSNVVEALRWVMGESSARGLRGGEMDDVIFAGSAVRAPYDLAEVALGLKRPPAANGDAAIHVLPTGEELEITRRIGRGTGSLYRLNGREVRARDIQLLFADVGSGAKSPAIVGQGQVGFIVEAKPEERRRLLEEAAGIGGMHSRRREAELKLQATEANLARVTDQLGLLADRHAALEKQAREAERYRKLQAQIRALEAYLVRARILAGRDTLAAAGEALAQARLGLGERRRLAVAAEAAHAAALAALPPLRDKAAVAAALLARLAERSERQAEAEARQRAMLERLAADRDETAARLEALVQAIETGAARQAAIAAAEEELGQRLEALAEEEAGLGPATAKAEAERSRLAEAEREAVAAEVRIERRLEADRARHDERHKRFRAVREELARLGEIAEEALVEAARRKHAEAQAAVGRAEAALEAARAGRDAALAPLDGLRRDLGEATSRSQTLRQDLAGQEAEQARRRAAIKGHHERRQWHERALRQLAEEAERLASEQARHAAASDGSEAAGQALAAMRERAAELDREIATAEERIAGLRPPFAEQERRLAEADGERLKLEAEAEALASLAEPVETTPILDVLAVDPGFETALVAALGDDLMAGGDATAIAHWAGEAATAEPPPLPAGLPSLTSHVQGAPRLARRLAQIGIAADAAEAGALQASLAQGQRLVTQDGGLWRWDGFVRGSEADDPIRRKLARRQRAQAIAARLETLKAERATLDRELAAARGALAAAEAERAALVEERTALLPEIEHRARAIEAAREAAARRLADCRRIETALARVASERQEHETALAGIAAALADEDTAPLDAEIATRRQALAEAERRAAGLRSALAQAEAKTRVAETALTSAEAEERRAAQEALAARHLFERRAGEAELRKAHREEATGTLTAEEARLRQELEALDASLAADGAALAEAGEAALAARGLLAAANAEAERLRGRSMAARSEASSAAERRRMLAEEAGQLATDQERRTAERQAAVVRLATLEVEHGRQAVAMDAATGEALRRELASAEAAAGEAGERLEAAEAELARREAERREAEAGLARASEAAALAEAEVERQGEALRELEHETARRLGQPVEAVLAASAEGGEIAEALASEPQAQLEQRLDRLKASRERLGAVNLRAAIEREEVAATMEKLKSEAAELEAAIERLRRAIGTLNREARSRLEAIFADVDRHFRQLFQRLFGGGKAHLRLTNMEDPLNAGLELDAMPPGKKLQNIRLLSGGEKSLTALALVFAFFLTQPSPLCVLDEVDAALDDANVERFASLLEEMAKETETRFLVVTHHPLTMARMHRLFGVTMAERGVSRLVSVAFEEAERFKESA